MRREESKGLQLCYLLLNENGFDSLRFRDEKGIVLKQYTRFPKQRLSSFIKNNENVNFEEWELNIYSKTNRSFIEIARDKSSDSQTNISYIKIVGDKGSGLVITYCNTSGEYTTDYVCCSEFVYCPTLISLLKKKQLIKRIENTLDMKGKLYERKEKDYISRY